MYLKHFLAALFAVTACSFCVAASAEEKNHAPTKTPTVASRLAERGGTARGRMQPRFKAAGVSYPPEKISFLVLKRERILQVYASGKRAAETLICEYPIAALSGKLGPKLREGDMQVPEGIYGVTFLNPTSRFTYRSPWITRTPLTGSTQNATGAQSWAARS